MFRQDYSQGSYQNSEIRIFLANERNFYTNVRELTHQFVNEQTADIIIEAETFLDYTVLPNYACIRIFKLDSEIETHREEKLHSVTK